MRVVGSPYRGPASPRGPEAIWTGLEVKLLAFFAVHRITAPAPSLVAQDLEQAQRDPRQVGEARTSSSVNSFLSPATSWSRAILSS